MQRQIVVKSSEDIGAVFTVSGRKFTATPPHGVLDPQPDPVLADIMSQMSCFQWQGFVGDQPQKKSNVPPTLEEMRARLAGLSADHGSPMVADGAPLALKRILGRNIESEIDESFEKTPGPPIASLQEIKKAVESKAAAKYESDVSAMAVKSALDVFDNSAPVEQDVSPIISEESEQDAEKLDALAQLGEDAASILEAASKPAPAVVLNPVRKKR
jgi:hypothetical protein